MPDYNSPQPLNKSHVLNNFDCGNEPLSSWLKKHASQSQSSGHTMTMVVTEAQSNIVIAYYSFSVISVEHSGTTPERVKKGLARYPIPVFLIARLAVDREHQGARLGSRLLLHALRRAALAAAENVPIRAVVVDAIDQSAKDFYRQFEFEPWPVDGFRLWLMMKDLQATLAEDGPKSGKKH